MYKFRQYITETDLWQKRFDEPHKVQAAIKFRGKIYKSLANRKPGDGDYKKTHIWILDNLMKKFSPEVLDNELTPESFGFVVNGKFVSDEDADVGISKAENPSNFVKDYDEERRETHKLYRRVHGSAYDRKKQEWESKEENEFALPKKKKRR